MKRNTTPVVDAIGELRFSGNIMHRAWMQRPELRLANGKANPVARDLLADCLYWYRPVETVDESTNQIVSIDKKFARDKWQIDYGRWGAQFGYTHRQVKDAALFLERAGLVRREVRTITYTVKGETYTKGSAVFIEPIPAAILKIHTPLPLDHPDLQFDAPRKKGKAKKKADADAVTSGGQEEDFQTRRRYNVRPGDVTTSTPVTLQRRTYTEITPETTGTENPEDSSPLRSEESSSGGFATGAAGEQEDTPLRRGPVLGGDDGHTRGADGEAGTQVESVKQAKPTPVKRAGPKQTPTPKAPAPRPRNPVFDAAARFIVGSDDPETARAAGSEAGKVIKHLKDFGITEADEVTRVGQFIQSECFVSPGVVKHGSWVKWLPDYLARREAILAGKAYEPVRQEKSAGGLRPQVAARLKARREEESRALQAAKAAPAPEVPADLDPQLAALLGWESGALPLPDDYEIDF